MIDWFCDFNHFKLFEDYQFKKVGISGNAFNLTSFFKIQHSYRAKVTNLLEDIWFRGVILIIKKNKFLRMKNQKYGNY